MSNPKFFFEADPQVSGRMRNDTSFRWCFSKRVNARYEHLSTAPKIKLLANVVLCTTILLTQSGYREELSQGHN